jgi:hypothetical protein
MQACSGDEGGSSNAELKANIGIDFANVTGFALAGGGTGSQLWEGVPLPRQSGGGDEETELYALNADGSISQVNLTDTESSAAYPIAVFDTKAYLVLFVQGIVKDGQQCRIVLARKSDGALYCSAIGSGSNNLWAEYWSPVQSDATGNILWVNLPPQDIRRLDLTNPESPTETQPIDMSAHTGGTLHNAVNPDGDSLVSYFAQGAGFVRVLKANGGFHNASAFRGGCLTPGVDANPNDFYYVDNDSTLTKLTKAGGNFTSSTHGAMQASCRAGLVRTQTHLFFSQGEAGGGTPSNVFFEVVGDVVTARTVTEFSALTRIAASDTALMILGTDSSGNGGVVKYDPAGPTFSTLLTPGDYTLDTMDVASNGDVTFHGQRASDGAFILGTIPNGTTTVTVVSTGLPKVSQLIRIN